MLEEYPDILTAQEAMEILGVGKNRLYQLFRDGALPAFRLGGRIWRIRKDLLLDAFDPYAK